MKRVKYTNSDRKQEIITSQVDADTILRKWSLKTFQETKTTIAVVN